MDFFHGQETLTAMQWVLRAVVGYFFMLIMAKLMGQRSISQLNLLDFAIAVVIGNIIAHPLSDEKLGLKGFYDHDECARHFICIKCFHSIKIKIYKEIRFA